MNKDASEFSLEKVAKAIKPNIKRLPFKRLSDYTGFLDGKEKVGDVVYHLQLWEAHTRLPAHLKSDFKAYGFPIGGEVFIPQVAVKPMRIEQSWLIVVCPNDELVWWALQKMKFVPEKHSGHYYVGSSEIWQVDDRNLRGLGGYVPDLSVKCWGAIMRWVMLSLDDRKKASTSLEVLSDYCSAEIISGGLNKPPIKITA
jgi:hypothetical protein